MSQFKDWIMKHESSFKAYCKLCSKAIELSNMGKRALTSRHAESKIHKKAVSLKHGTTKMEQFVKSEKASGADNREESSITETLTISLPADAPCSSHSSHSQQEVQGPSQQLLKAYVTGECYKSRSFVGNEKCSISFFLQSKC